MIYKYFGVQNIWEGLWKTFIFPKHGDEIYIHVEYQYLHFTTYNIKNTCIFFIKIANCQETILYLDWILYAAFWQECELANFYPFMILASVLIEHASSYSAGGGGGTEQFCQEGLDYKTCLSVLKQLFGSNLYGVGVLVFWEIFDWCNVLPPSCILIKFYS